MSGTPVEVLSFVQGRGAPGQLSYASGPIFGFVLVWIYRAARSNLPVSSQPLHSTPMTKRMTAGEAMSKIEDELATEHSDAKKIRRIFMMSAKYVVTNIDDPVDRTQENGHPCTREVQIKFDF